MGRNPAGNHPTRKTKATIMNQSIRSGGVKRSIVNAVCRMMVAVLLTGFGILSLTAQENLSVVREIQLQGTFQLLVGDEITITDVDGKLHRLRIQADADKPIGLSGGDVALALPAEIQMRTTVDRSVLREGMTVSLLCQLGANGKTGKVTSASLLPIGDDVGAEAGSNVSVSQMPMSDELVDAEVLGVISSINDKQMTIDVPRHELVPKQRLVFSLDQIDELQLEWGSLKMLQPGDVISKLDAAEVSTGDFVVRRLTAELVGQRSDLCLTIHQQLQLKHWRLSNDPTEPRDLRSQHFLLTTDASERQARVLLDKLEAMFDLIAKYFGKQPSDPVQLYVVNDLAKWNTSTLDARAVKKIRLGEGTTLYARVGRNQQALVFSADNHDVVQHEAVHGFCYLAFQGTGPLWYAEGMAEMGQYWQNDDSAVSANPAVIGYLRSRAAQPLNTIINATVIEGETWKAYAWRWALCHFLATNPNYATEFQRLGKALMRKSRGASFENTWRRQASQLTFEYQHFLKHLEAGLRADLIAWQWDTRFAQANTGRAIQKKIGAARGWQATGAIVKKGEAYETRAKGKWQLSPSGPEIDANGDGNGQGRLVAVIMDQQFELSEEFPLGTKPDFVAIAEGQLYVR